LEYLKINTPDRFDDHYFNFLHIKNNPWLKIKNYKCISRTKELMRCNVVKSQKIDHGHKNCTWASGYNAVLLHTIHQNVIITKVEFAIGEIGKTLKINF
jgi:hypothetical protein